MTECVFCDIIQQRIAAWVVYQNEDVICFLPRNPEVYGHTLIVPKQHVVDLYTTPTALLEKLMAAAQKLSIHYKAQVGASGVNLLHASGASAQQSVFHFHLHLLPRFDGDGLNTWPELPTLSFDRDEMLKQLMLKT